MPDSRDRRTISRHMHANIYGEHHQYAHANISTTRGGKYMAQWGKAWTVSHLLDKQHAGCSQLNYLSQDNLSL